MAKKKNPNVTLKASDIKRMKAEITKSAVNKAFIMFFTVLHDKWGFGQKRLEKVLSQIVSLGDMLDETPHTVTLEQLKKTLKEELNIEFE